jgi:hypothetical protein
MAADAPAKKNITVFKGTAFKMRIVVQNQNGTARSLIGYSAKMQVRGDVDDVSTVLSLTPTVDTINGYVDVVITKTQTASLTVDAAVWDLWIDNGGSDSPEYIVGGGMTIRKAVTQ